MRCTAATSTCTATGYWEPTALPKERSWACCCAQGKDWSDQGCRAGHGSFLQREDGYGRGDEASVAVRAGHPWRLACLAFARPEVNAYGGGPRSHITPYPPHDGGSYSSVAVRIWRCFSI